MLFNIEINDAQARIIAKALRLYEAQPGAIDALGDDKDDFEYLPGMFEDLPKQQANCEAMNPGVPITHGFTF